MMLTVETLEGGIAHESLTDAPTPGDVLAALSRLDGRATTQMWLDDLQGSYIQATGPCEGRYALDLVLASGEYLHARVSHGDERLVRVPAGIDEVELPSGTLVSKAVAEQALLHFLTERGASPVIEWELSSGPPVL